MFDSIDIRVMTIEEIDALFPDEGQELKAKLGEFLDTYMLHIGNLSLNTFSSLYGYSLDYFDNLQAVLNSVTCGCISALLQDAQFSSVQVLGHFRKDGLHLFPFLPLEKRYCVIEKPRFYSMACICQLNDFCFFGEYVINDMYTLIRDDIQTFEDVYRFLCSHSDITDYPSLSL